MSEQARTLFCQAAADLENPEEFSRGSLTSALQILLPVFLSNEEFATLEPQISGFRALVRPLVESRTGLIAAIEELDEHGMQLVASLILSVDLKGKQAQDPGPGQE